MMEKKISRQINLLRFQLNMSQRDLAAKSGISQRVISSMEDAKSLTLPNLEAVAEAFGMSLSELCRKAEDLELGIDTVGAA